MFIPASLHECHQRGWDQLDVILVTGDAYIDSPFMGVAVIGHILMDAGFRVGIISQPATETAEDITRLGEPLLFWGITAGSIDSMVANRTASGKKRRSDDYTPGGRNNRRPDRAVLAYSNLIRRHFKQTVPLVLGGIEASLRRIAHYDYWSDKVRRSILVDSKADYLLYGMADTSILALASYLQKRQTLPLRAGKGRVSVQEEHEGMTEDIHTIRGLSYITTDQTQIPSDALHLPSFEEVSSSQEMFITSFQHFYANNDARTARPLVQQHAGKILIQTPPPYPLQTKELDTISMLPFERRVHPIHAQEGEVKALHTIQFAITSHRGCYGECNFCAIAVHQGRTVQSRSQDSLLHEARLFTKHPDFKGIIADVGGPTANMYGFECGKKHHSGSCQDKRCLYPKPCSALPVNHGKQIRLLQSLRNIPGIKRVFIASGIRYDLILADKEHGEQYLRELIRYHLSGQMKVAPEHCMDTVLDHMGKPSSALLLRFRNLFTRLNHEERKKLFLTYYLIAAHPGCTLQDMQNLRRFAQDNLKVLPRQIQIFTPTPSTWSTLMYWTGINPLINTRVHVEKTFQGREKQKGIMQVERFSTGKGKEARKQARTAMQPHQRPSEKTGKGRKGRKTKPPSKASQQKKTRPQRKKP